MSPLEPGNPITSGFEKCNTAEAQNKDLKVPFVSMIKVLKGEISKPRKKFYENTNKQWKEMNKAMQDLKIERESTKKKSKLGGI